MFWGEMWRGGLWEWGKLTFRSRMMMKWLIKWLLKLLWKEESQFPSLAKNAPGLHCLHQLCTLQVLLPCIERLFYSVFLQPRTCGGSDWKCFGSHRDSHFQVDAIINKPISSEPEHSWPVVVDCLLPQCHDRGVHEKGEKKMFNLSDCLFFFLRTYGWWARQCVCLSPS